MQYSTAIHNDYVFDNTYELPTGNIKLTVLGGDAWVFTEACKSVARVAKFSKLGVMTLSGK